VMEKAGMEFERSFDRGGVRHVLYRRRAQPPPTK
jgi:hypothetical protein